MDRWDVAVVQAFKGERFREGQLDVEVAVELSAYRELVLDVARSLWLQENRERQRLPRGFDQDFQLRLAGLSKGSTVATLCRNTPQGKQFGFNGDVYSRAMTLVEACVRAADTGGALPAHFPRSALTRFRRWGASLGSDECIELRSPGGEVVATYGSTARANLLDRIDTSYENAADEVGYVLATSIRAGRFELYRDANVGEGVVVPLDSAYESKVLKALSQHDKVKLRVFGSGAFTADGSLVRFTKVTDVQELEREVDNAGLWSRIDALSRLIPETAWANLSPDAAENHDAYM